MRRISRIGIATIIVAVTLAFVSSPAFAKGKKQKGAHATAGKVTAVDPTSITVQTKKQGSKQFQLTATTVYEKASKDKSRPATAATLADVRAGRHVKIVASANQAQKVTISPQKSKGGKGKGQGQRAKKHA